MSVPHLATAIGTPTGIVLGNHDVPALEAFVGRFLNRGLVNISHGWCRAPAVSRGILYKDILRI